MVMLTVRIVMTAWLHLDITLLLLNFLISPLCGVIKTNCLLMKYFLILVSLIGIVQIVI